ncbi:MAG: dihydroxyacetone kinase subunit DhaK [Actinobacteria bacterium]|nr:dihydroxyacetone kinase subunit DhaK [Actinomycetota bacterium]
MKKLINNPNDIVNELVEGFLFVNKGRVKRVGNLNVVARMEAPVKGKVGIVIGGGAGHEPLFLEYIGTNMADVEVHGNIFAAPSPKAILEGIKAANGGAGVILLYNNYSGDVFNFNAAQDLARKEGILVDTVLINDEISSAPKEFMEDRRGTTADHIIIKIAGSSAQSGMDFGSIKKLLRRAIYNSRSLGVSLSACTLPETGLATFTLEEGKMEFGMGLHGEAGIKKVDLMTADETAKSILNLLIEDLPFKKGDEVIVIVNGYGATTRMEMFIVMRAISFYLKEKDISIYSSEIGEFCTSQEMAGISITLIKLDDEIREFYDMSVDSPGYRKF